LYRKGKEKTGGGRGRGEKRCSWREEKASQVKQVNGLIRKKMPHTFGRGWDEEV